MAEYCPHHATCPFYQNWVEQTGDRRTDVIVDGSVPGLLLYNCLTLIKGNISDELKSRVSNPHQRNFDCSYIALLNHTLNLERKLNDLSTPLKK